MGHFTHKLLLSTKCVVHTVDGKAEIEKVIALHVQRHYCIMHEIFSKIHPLLVCTINCWMKLPSSTQLGLNKEEGLSDPDLRLTFLCSTTCKATEYKRSSCVCRPTCLGPACHNQSSCECVASHQPEQKKQDNRSI